MARRSGERGGTSTVGIEQAVILAAGRGTRLGDLTRERPKSMLPVLGQPILARVMERLGAAGARRFVLVVGPRDEEAARSLHVDGADEIVVAVQPSPTGTVDALLCAAPALDGAFLLSSVDNLTSPAHVRALAARFTATAPVAALSLLPANPEQIRRSSGVVVGDGRVLAIEEKPADPQGRYAAIMLYAFAPDFLRYLPGAPVSPRGEREIASAIQASIAEGRAVTYAIAEERLHLTHELDLLAINRAYLRAGADAAILSDLPPSVTITPPVRIDPGVTVGAGARLGPCVYLEAGATVGAGASLEDCVVLAGGAVAPGATLCHALVERRIYLSELHTTT